MLTKMSQSEATIETTIGLLMNPGLSIASVATAAGIVPETMNTAEATSKDHPVKKPSMGWNISPTHTKEAPALVFVRFRCINAKLTPNMMSPQ